MAAGNFNAGGNPVMDWNPTPTQGSGVGIYLVASVHGNFGVHGVNFGLMGHWASTRLYTVDVCMTVKQACLPGKRECIMQTPL